MTRQLYLEDAYIFSFEATVVDIKKIGAVYMTVLDKTAFFPEGGGQSGDRGKIGDTQIVSTYAEGDDVLHVSEMMPEYKAGDCVQCSVFSEERLEKMRQHTAEHIVSGTVNRLFGLDNVGFHLGDEDVTMDFNGILDREQLTLVENVANEAVMKNVDIKCEILSPKEALRRDFRSKIDFADKNVRVVTVDGYDSCACCAPHVKMTGEISVIKILDAVKYKGGIRVHMKAGTRALEDYRQRYENTYRISCALSASQDEVYSAVQRMIDENSSLKTHIKNTIRADVNRILHLLPKKENLLLVVSGVDSEYMRLIAGGALSMLICRRCAVVTDNGKGQLMYAVSSAEFDAADINKMLKENLSAKGGGKGDFVFGTLYASEEETKSFFVNQNFSTVVL